MVARWEAPREAGSPAPAQYEPSPRAWMRRTGLPPEQQPPKGRWWGHHRLRGTERCRSQQNLLVGSDWKGNVFLSLLRQFCSTFNPLSLPVGAARPGRRLCQPPPALHQGSCLWLKLEPQIPGGEPRALRGLILLNGRKEGSASRRPLCLTRSSGGCGEQQKEVPAFLTGMRFLK